MNEPRKLSPQDQQAVMMAMEAHGRAMESVKMARRAKLVRWALLLGGGYVAYKLLSGKPILRNPNKRKKKRAWGRGIPAKRMTPEEIRASHTRTRGGVRQHRYWVYEKVHNQLSYRGEVWAKNKTAANRAAKRKFKERPLHIERA